MLLQLSAGAATQSRGCMSALTLHRLAMGLRLQLDSTCIATGTAIYLRQDVGGLCSVPWRCRHGAASPASPAFLPLLRWQQLVLLLPPLFHGCG